MLARNYIAPLDDHKDTDKAGAKELDSEDNDEILVLDI